MVDDFVAAIEDFELTLLSEGPRQACNTLLSYSVELTGARAEAYEKILQTYCNYLERSEACRNAGGWSNRFETNIFLTSFLEADPILVVQLQRSWQRSLSSVLFNVENASVGDHLARIKALQNFLPEALAGAAAAFFEGRCPCNDQTLRSLTQAALFSLAQNPELDHNLERLLEMYFASYVNGATTPLALASLVQTSFEAFMETIQAPATVQCIVELNHESSGIYWMKAWTLVSTLQKISSTACDIFWGAFASTVRQLATLVIRHGRDHLGISCVVKLLCNSNSASILLQCLLANPTMTPATTGGAAKSAFKTALVLLRDFPEAYVSACCDILTSAANATLVTRLEALHGKRMVAKTIYPSAFLLRLFFNVVFLLSIIAAIKLAINYHSSNEKHFWTQDALDKLLFALCRVSRLLFSRLLDFQEDSQLFFFFFFFFFLLPFFQDPSVRLRRKAIELLQHVIHKGSLIKNAATEEAAALAAITERCTDQDADVRRVAHTCLNNSVQFTKLVSILDIAQWRRIFGEGLAEEGAATTRQAREIFSASKRLFEKYLRQDEEDSRLIGETEGGDIETGTKVAESKAVLRLNELFTSTVPVSSELMATLAEIFTERDLTYTMN